MLQIHVHSLPPAALYNRLVCTVESYWMAYEYFLKMCSTARISVLEQPRYLNVEVDVAHGGEKKVCGGRIN